MKKRLTQPKNNKYYIRTVSGGLNGAVAGKPTISGANVLCNCVGYANGRFNESINDPDLKGVIFKFKYQLVCNAENFIESAKRQGLKISSTPVEGGIMVWQKGRTLGGGDGAGHVAFVEEVYADGTIMTSESGYNAWAFKTIRRSNNNGRWGQASAYKFRGCIINPSIKNPKVVPAPKLVVDGIGGANTVRAMQRFFGTAQDGVISGQSKTLSKYYPSLKAVEYGKGGSPCIKKLQKWLGVTQDGVLGQKTIKKWQYVIGVDNDGVFGEASMKAWQKYLNNNDKAVYPKTPTKAPTVEQTWVQKANAWAQKIANDNSWHYVVWSSNKKTHECPICHKHPVGKFHGWNCIGFSWAVWHHGGNIPCKCNCYVIDNGTGNKMYKAKTVADALAIAKKHSGLSNITVVRKKGGIPKSEWKAGDICLRFSGSKYVHSFYYMGNGKIADSTGSNGKVPNDKQIAVRDYKKYSAKIIIRYTGK